MTVTGEKKREKKCETHSEFSKVETVPKASTRAPETVFALSSAPGRAGIAVFRISGPAADAVLGRLTRGPLPKHRFAVLRTLFDNMNNERIDDVIVLRFASPGSYTGENVVELHTHGGRAVVASVLQLLGSQPELRAAGPGEFTRRAVEHGRLDLTQAEAIADLINAETEAQRRQALRQFEGELWCLYQSWRERLIRAAAWIEASIDFPDEEVPASALAESKAQIAVLMHEMEGHLADGRRGEILRDGLHVAVIGPPNAGKSSLVNALAQRDVAIVSETAGTTRDVIEVRLDIEGYPVVLADTAGLRVAKDNIEAEGVRRAEARARAADVTLLVLDAASPSHATEQASEIAKNAGIVIWNKCDLVKTKRSGLMISAKTGEGLRELISVLANKAKEFAGTNEAPVLTRARHRNELQLALQSLRAALESFSDAEIAAEEIRHALQNIGRITGRVDLEEVLDSIFRDFCIGK